MLFFNESQHLARDRSTGPALCHSLDALEDGQQRGGGRGRAGALYEFLEQLRRRQWQRYQGGRQGDTPPPARTPLTLTPPGDLL